jgi:pilus assembly protein FimV
LTSEDPDAMAQTDTRPGFRLPWSSDRPDASDPDAPGPDASVDPGAAPATEETEGPDMIDAKHAAQDSDTTDAVAEPVATSEDEPEAVLSEPTEIPIAQLPVAAPEPPKPSAKSVKSTKFLADLTKAMQATAEAARNETLERFAAEAKTAVERVQTDAAEEITELRKSADEDVAAIREWSKGEIARIREETETRISTRKTYLEGELEGHAGVIERRVELINASVAAFEAEMAAFCERLFAEGDPATFAALAEQLPEPPSLDAPFVEPPALIGAHVAPEPVVPEPEAVTEVADEVVLEAPSVEASSTSEAAPEATSETEAPEAAAETADAPEATAETSTEDAPIDENDPRIAMLGMSPDFAAAEAEAEMSAAESDAGADAAEDVNQEIPTIAEEVVAARLAGLVPPSDAGEPSERVATKVVVSGLVSVASIAAFKRGVARTPGVASVGVTSGPDGEFVFMVSHNPSVDLKDVIPGLPGFNARVTGDSEDGFVVTARDPEAHD